MRSIGGFGLERWTRQMGTQHNTRHILHIAQKGSSPHDMSCLSKGITGSPTETPMPLALKDLHATWRGDDPSWVHKCQNGKIAHTYFGLAP